MYSFGARSKTKLSELHPLLIQILEEAIKTSPHDFGLHEGIRTRDEQYRMYQLGRTEPGKVVTSIDGIKTRGYHNYKPSLAFDFHISLPGKTWDVGMLTRVGQHIVKTAKDKFSIELIWGGDWKMRDYPHFQLPADFKKHADANGLF
jgi:peptidoglycan L-alanyl-D-glutamate endopeptidase CwlK